MTKTDPLKHSEKRGDIAVCERCGKHITTFIGEGLLNNMVRTDDYIPADECFYHAYFPEAVKNLDFDVHTVCLQCAAQIEKDIKDDEILGKLVIAYECGCFTGYCIRDDHQASRESSREWLRLDSYTDGFVRGLREKRINCIADYLEDEDEDEDEDDMEE